MKIKYNIRKIRLKKGYSQIQLSKKSGVCKSNISAYELEKIKKPSLHDMILISIALEVNLKDLFEVLED